MLFHVQVTGKLAALKGLDARLREIRGYLDLVIDGKLPLNHEILYHLQMLNKEHEKAEDSNSTAIPNAAGS
ncbi:hypothetical protein BHE74_00057302 [Ensete ventricosum]|uniref:Uncharacterized protein n=1 Tax=Ensete ventricosum TaxID=4639 RepID=A0A444G889_ENSVE|nr:hypothetical protein B296_00027597 [Ensete ventricosum]RWW31100.1 hypothetical protein GW17_00004283 [Ensete ventricosum]RWW37570.1 hypothetical protein BHE74_00057302 [Ensete ventricosum]